jgi:hypothetical protein
VFKSRKMIWGAPIPRAEKESLESLDHLKDQGPDWTEILKWTTREMKCGLYTAAEDCVEWRNFEKTLMNSGGSMKTYDPL